VRAKQRGREPDPRYALAGKQRSLHNTYFTLPVIFTMIAGHYAMTFGSRWNWLVLVALTLAGALIRVWFVQRHKGRAPAWVWISSVILVIAIAWLLAPKAQPAAEPVKFSEVTLVIEARCLACHSPKPAFQGLAEPPKGVLLDTPERVRAQAQLIYQQTALARAMPPGNITGMTEDERALIARWARIK